VQLVSKSRTILAIVAALLLLAACQPRPGFRLREAREAYAQTQGKLRRILRAFERYQGVASLSREGPIAAEAAYALGLLALDLHVFVISPLVTDRARAATLERELNRLNVPAGALVKFALRVFAVSRDASAGADRERAERALELATLRERAEGEIVDIARRAPASPIARLAALDAILAEERRLIGSLRNPELVERAILLQRATWLTWLRFIDEPAGCAVISFLAKATLSVSIDAERPVAACLSEIDREPRMARARLVRAGWVRLEEFLLDRPNGRVAPLARKILALAPAEARAPVPRR
jgi:hypothetical protein